MFTYDSLQKSSAPFVLVEIRFEAVLISMLEVKKNVSEGVEINSLYNLSVQSSKHIKPIFRSG